MRLAYSLLLGTVLLSSASTSGQEIPTTDGSRFDLKNGKAEATIYRDRSALKLTEIDSDRGGAYAVLKNVPFHNGVIDLDVSGTPAKTAGAAGRLHRRRLSDAERWRRYETLYIRPANGRAEDQFATAIIRHSIRHHPTGRGSDCGRKARACTSRTPTWCRVNGRIYESWWKGPRLRSSWERGRSRV